MRKEKGSAPMIRGKLGDSGVVSCSFVLDKVFWVVVSNIFMFIPIRGNDPI